MLTHDIASSEDNASGGWKGGGGERAYPNNITNSVSTHVNTNTSALAQDNAPCTLLNLPTAHHHTRNRFTLIISYHAVRFSEFLLKRCPIRCNSHRAAVCTTWTHNGVPIQSVYYHINIHTRLSAGKQPLVWPRCFRLRSYLQRRVTGITQHCALHPISPSLF